MVKEILRKSIPWSIYKWLAMQKSIVRMLGVRIMHWNVKLRIVRKVRKGEKIRVLFLVSEIAKWKAQSLWNLMIIDDKYEPMIGIMRQDASVLTDEPSEISAAMQAVAEYFQSKRMPTVMVYNPIEKCPIPLERFAPDLIFYQQPWNLQWTDDPAKVAKFALACYIPYYVPNYINPKLDEQLDFHRLLAYYFSLNEEYHKRNTTGLPLGFFSGCHVVVGHTMLDDYYLSKDRPVKRFVIYAPHVSFNHPNNHVSSLHYSTFMETGMAMLAYAKRHPEIGWVFKPHPSLRTALISSGAWNEKKVDEYYKAWSDIGVVCTTRDYFELFGEAKAMVTDCGSFLTEFAVTGQPIIHLINNKNCFTGPKLFDTYYKVTKLDELYPVLDRVLIEKDDFMRRDREKALSEANIIGKCAAKNILKVFAKEFNYE